MRLPTGKAIRVERGDIVTLHARLPASTQAQLGRLYVFSKEGEAEFSPYVSGTENTINGGLMLMKPVSLRLTTGQPVRAMSFASDIDGFICVMQEVDTAKDPLAKVKLQRKINPELPWQQRVARKLQGMFSWSH